MPDQVNAVALGNTARIFHELQADILCVVEADNRTALIRFNEDAIPNIGGTPFAHVMLIDGNDERGIDLGLLTVEQYLGHSVRGLAGLYGRVNLRDWLEQDREALQRYVALAEQHRSAAVKASLRTA